MYKVHDFLLKRDNMGGYDGEVIMFASYEFNCGSDSEMTIMLRKICEFYLIYSCDT